MFVAMNRFQVKTGSEKAFETVWATRESYLGNMAGFVEFHLLKGPVADDHTLYSSHTTWVDKAAPMPAPTTKPAKASIWAIPSSRALRSSRASASRARRLRA